MDEPQIVIVSPDLSVHVIGEGVERFYKTSTPLFDDLCVADLCALFAVAFPDLRGESFLAALSRLSKR